jgi:hypothetical protein
MSGRYASDAMADEPTPDFEAPTIAKASACFLALLVAARLRHAMKITLPSMDAKETPRTALMMMPDKGGVFSMRMHVSWPLSVVLQSRP